MKIGTEAQRHIERHKDAKAQGDRAEGFFCFVPLCLCPFVPHFEEGEKWNPNTTL